MSHRQLSVVIDRMARAVARTCERFDLGMGLLRTCEFRGKYRIVMHVRPTEVLADLGGIRYRLDLADRIQRLAYFNLYRDGDVDRILELVPPDGTCIDVGANVGFYALSLAKRVGPRGAVHVFEPDPDTFRRLNDNVDLNGLRDIVRTYSAAVTNQTGNALFYRSGPVHTAWGSLVEFKDIAVGTITVPTVSLDEFLRVQGIDQVDFVKVDVEAGEFELLEGAETSLRNQVFRNVLIEFNGVRLAERGRTLGEFLEVFARHRYRPVELNLALLRSMRDDDRFARQQCVNLLFQPHVGGGSPLEPWSCPS